MIKTLILLLLLLATFFNLLKLNFNDGIRLIEKINIIILFIFGIVLVTNPLILKSICEFLNIKRPVDFYYYIYILGNTWFVIRTHLRINRLESKMGKIISYIALEKKNKD